MAKVSGLQVARWAGSAGWRTPNLEVAVAVGLANGSDPAKPGGVWGVGGPAGDGAGQARAAHAQWQSQGWDEFPAWRSNAWRLFTPLAVAAIAAAGVASVPGAVGGAVGAGADAAAGAVASPFKPAIDVAAYVGTDEFWGRTVKVVLGATMLIIAAASLAWTGFTRPFFQAVGVLDSKIQSQMDVGDAQPVRIVK